MDDGIYGFEKPMPANPQTKSTEKPMPNKKKLYTYSFIARIDRINMAY